jgi:hypothetical protein
VENQAREALQTLLHPLRGGSRGRGLGTGAGRLPGGGGGGAGTAGPG